MEASGRRRLVLFTALLVVAACSLIFWLVTREQQRLNDAALMQQVLGEAEMVRAVLSEDWPDVRRSAVVVTLGMLRDSGVELAVFGNAGNVLYDGTGAGVAEQMARHTMMLRGREQGIWSGIRKWGARGRWHAMVTARVGQAGQDEGVIWLARPCWAVTQNPGAVARLLFIEGVIVALASVVVALIFIQMRRRVFHRVIRTARRLSAGDLTTELRTDGSDEIAVLSTALEGLRRRLAIQMETIDRQRRMLQSLVDHLGEGVIVVDVDGRIALINPAAVKLLNLRGKVTGEQTLIGTPVETCIREHALQQLLLEAPCSPEALTGVDAADETSGGLPSPDAYIQIETTEGTTHLLVRATQLDLAESRPDADSSIGRVAVLTDITELERTIEVRTDFVANASHELRTPLSTIRACVETLLAMDLGGSPDAAAEFLQKIDRHSDRLQQMVADLLDLSRLESPAERFEMERIEVRRVAHELQFRFAEAIDEKQLHWEWRCAPEGLSEVRANMHLLRLALDNLVDNAIKHTQPGGHIRLLVKRTAEAVEFEVSDDGCGISSEDQERVFERFFQVQRSRTGTARGTGLGLSIVRHAVEAMQGQVRLESALGRGTRVTLRVPQSVSEDMVEIATNS